MDASDLDELSSDGVAFADDLGRGQSGRRIADAGGLEDCILVVTESVSVP